jgi:ferredoxin
MYQIEHNMAIVSHITSEGRWSVSQGSAVNLLEVDRKKCCGYGMCADLCPAVFSLDEAGLVVANMTEVPDELIEATDQAAYNCPAEAITLRKRAE